MSISAALGIFSACAQGQDGIDIGGGTGPVNDGGAEGGARLPGTDAGGSSSGDPDTDPDDEDDSGSGPGCTGKVVINELQTRGATAAQEFVELYNPNSCAVSLAGWKLPYKSDTGNGNTVLHTFASGASIPAQSFLVLGTASFSVNKDVTMTGGNMSDQGQVGLVDDTGSVVDAVGFGATLGPYIEGTAAASPSANGSIGRKSDGLDTDNNASDFARFSTPSPGVSN
ncbi:MAG: lamin tail domain-containing protein [Labilithrix sp.]|nr:lamin tail domain-containing protein [Labilithrix sp.]